MKFVVKSERVWIERIVPVSLRFERLEVMREVEMWYHPEIFSLKGLVLKYQSSSREKSKDFEEEEEEENAHASPQIMTYETAATCRENSREF